MANSASRRGFLLGAAVFLLSCGVGSAFAESVWNAAGPMAGGRYQFRMTRLLDGRVLATGGRAGYSPSATIATCEIWDPETLRWRPTGPMNFPRAGHAAALLPDGRVLVAGSAGATSDSAEIFDPASETWTTIASKAYLGGGTALSLGNGRVFVLTSSSTATTAELFDPTTETWTKTPSLGAGRILATTTLLNDGRVLVASGRDSHTTGLVYNPTGNSWTATGPHVVSRASHTATLLADGRVLVAGGEQSGTDPIAATAEIYDPGLNTWTATGSMASARSQHTATLLTDGTVLVAGGTAAGNASGLYTCELYSPASGTFSTAPRISQARYSHQAIPLSDGTVLLSGGTASFSYFPTLNTDLFSEALEDTAAPTVAITSPTSGAMVVGNVPITANASDDTSIVSVAFYVDGSWKSNDDEPPYEASWDTTGLWGPYTLMARARDRANKTTDTSVSVSVRDTTPPGVQLVVPSEGMTVGNPVLFEAWAWDNDQLVRVDFLVDGEVVASDGSSPFIAAVSAALIVPGSHVATARAWDSAGLSTTSSPVSFTATVTTGGSAVFDAALGVPACASGSDCDSGALLNGRDTVPDQPEPNAPNTLHGSCPDGASGTYHVQGSLDRLRVRTLDASPFAPGATVEVSATVWAYSAGNALDIYYAPDVANPVWSLVGTWSVPGPGEHVLTTSFVLSPGGARQAIRGTFRFSNEPHPTEPACTNGVTDDHDDLVFSAGAGPVETNGYHPWYQTPACLGFGPECSSGDLLVGRASLGPEPNAPNTSFGECQDGDLGGLHVDPSVDRIRVLSLGTNPLRLYDQAQILVTVYASSEYANERLDLFEGIGSLGSPSWQYLGSLTPSGPGLQTLSLTYTLEGNSIARAVRAAYRRIDAGPPPFPEPEIPCHEDALNDHDDLWFRIDSGPTAHALAIDGTSVDDASGNILVYYANGNFIGSCAVYPGMPPMCEYDLPENAEIVLTPLAQSGSSFGGWSGACAGVGTCAITLTGARQVSARFVPAVLATLTVEMTGVDGAQGVVRAWDAESPGAELLCEYPASTSCSQQFQVGAFVRLSAYSPTPDSFFAGWGGACAAFGSAPECLIAMGDSATATVHFSGPQTLTVTATGQEGGYGGLVAQAPDSPSLTCSMADTEPVSCSQTYPLGTVVTLTATPAAGSAFTRWSGACTGGGPCAVTMSVARSVTATFAPPLAVTWTSMVGVTGSLLKTAPVGWNAGAISTLQLSGDGYVESTVVETNTTRAFGLGLGNPGLTSTEIDYPIELRADGTVWAEGVSFGPYAAGEVFRVQVAGSAVTYLRDGALLHTSAVPPTHPLVVDTALYSADATLASVVVAGDWALPPYALVVSDPTVAESNASVTFTVTRSLVSQSTAPEANTRVHSACSACGSSSVRRLTPSNEVSSMNLRRASALLLPLAFAATAHAQAPIIADHTKANLSATPAEWVVAAKETLHIAYGHTSHGSQVTEGMTGLAEWKGDLYAWREDAVEAAAMGALHLDDYAMPGDLGSGSWAADTRTYLNAHPETNVIIWSWCGQAGYDETDIEAYLTQMSQLESQYTNVKFVYMTGHLVGQGMSGTLWVNNERIRAYARANNKILFDFADIESFDPDGLVNYNQLFATDNCDYDSDGNGSLDQNWAINWQNTHTEGIDWYNVGAAHSQALNGNRKAYAAWWLWARLAGMPVEGLSVEDSAATEGNGESAQAQLDVNLEPAATTETVTVQFQTVNGTATAGSDYVALALGTLTFLPGETSKTITVDIIGDTTREANETFILRLSNATNATIAKADGIATILDDDLAATIADATVTEGNSGTSFLTFPVTLEAAAPSEVRIDYVTANGTATAGSAGSGDYLAATGTLVIPSGSSSGQIQVTVYGDTTPENAETLTLTLSNPTGVSLTRTVATGTINNDDVPSVSFASATVSQAEGNTNSNLTLTVNRSVATPFSVSVNYATANGTATAGSDYTVASGTLTIASGATSGTITVPIIGDTAVESNETFTVALSNPVSCTIGTGTVTVTITNDDGSALPTLTIADKSQAEGNSGTANMPFTVTLSALSATNVTVVYATSNGTATSGSDYTATSGTLTIPAGQLTGTINVPILGDATAESDETFTVTLSSPTNATIADGSATGTITNDDGGGTTVPVLWTSETGVTVSGNNLTKTAVAGFGNAGAISAQVLSAGAGFVRLTASETNTSRMFGLGNGNANASYTDIEFALHLNSNGSLQAYEAGVSRGNIGTYVTGDSLEVSLEGGAVLYKKNGSTLYTSSATPSYPLLVDSALSSAGATLNAVVVGGAWTTPAPPPAVAVIWTAPVGVTVNGSSLTKTATAGFGNAGALSAQQLPSGDGFVQIIASETNSGRIFGLGVGNTNAGYADVEYGLYLNNANLQVYEAGVSRGTVGSYVTGDTLQVAVDAGAVRYKKNGTVLYSSAVAPTYPMAVDTALSSVGSTINSASVGGGAWAIPAVWTSPIGVAVDGSSLTKTATTTGFGNAGAISTLQLLSGDGFVQVVASETTTARIFGLGVGNTNAGYADIEFGMYLNNSTLQVYEAGVSRGSFGSFATGDILQVSLEGGSVRYKKNNTVLYTSAVTATYPMLADTALSSVGATLTSVALGGAWAIPPAPAATAVVWTAAQGVAVATNNLTKTAAAGFGNAGAISTLQLPSGNGFVQAIVSETNTSRMFGLGTGNANTGYADIEFAFHLAANGALQVYEAGVLRAAVGTYATGDYLQVAVEGTTVRYKRNGLLVYTSSVTPTYPLVVDTALATVGSTLTSVGIDGNWQ